MAGEQEIAWLLDVVVVLNGVVRDLSGVYGVRIVLSTCLLAFELDSRQALAAEKGLFELLASQNFESFGMIFRVVACLALV